MICTHEKFNDKSKEIIIMNKEELLKLREQVVAGAKVLAVEGGAPAEDRLPLVLELAHGGDIGLLKKAFEIAGEITDGSARLNAMLDIIAAIDEDLAGSEGVSTEDETQNAQK